MNALEIALSAPGLPKGPRVLMLFDCKEPTPRWLEASGAILDRRAGALEISPLIESEEHWDLIVATCSMQRFYDTTLDSDLQQFSRWLRGHSKVCLLTPRKFFVDPARNAIGPWRLDDAFLEFEFISELNVSGSEKPTVVLSDLVLWDGENWREKAEFLHLGQPQDCEEGQFRPTLRRRRHLSSDGTIFKTEVGNAEYFESLEVIREADAIAALGSQIGGTLDLPTVLSLRRGSTLSTLHRQALNGVPLLEALATSALSREALFEQVLDCAIGYSSAGLFHNDFRPWNFLVTSGGLTLIDYAGVSRFDLDTRRLPQVVALIGTLVALSEPSDRMSSVRMFEDFDEDALAVVGPVLHSLGIDIESLYTARWLELPIKRERILGIGPLALVELVRVICSAE